MRVRALQSCQVQDTFRKGPEFNDKDEQIGEGEEFDVPDDFVVNRDVLEVIKPPAKGEVRYWDPDAPVTPATKGRKGGGVLTGAGAATGVGGSGAASGGASQ